MDTVLFFLSSLILNWTFASCVVVAATGIVGVFRPDWVRARKPLARAFKAITFPGQLFFLMGSMLGDFGFRKFHK